jgi:hypothetical protein
MVTHQLPVYVGNVHTLDRRVCTTKKNTEALVVAIKQVG